QVGTSSQTITIRKSETLANTSFEQLVALINQKISQTEVISGKVTAGTDGTHLELTAIGDTPVAFSVHDANTEAQTSLGLAAGTTSSADQQIIFGASAIPLFYGLTGDATFSVNGTSLTLPASVTTDNHSILDLVADINVLLTDHGI